MPMEKMVEFKIVKEDWGIYKLKDGTIIKNKGVPIFFIDHEEKDAFGNPLFEIHQQNVAGVYASIEKRGTPSAPIPPSELSNYITEQDIAFEVISEPWNEYSLDGGIIIKVKLTLVTLTKTSQYDVRGQPLYLINAQPVFKVIKSKS